MLLLILGVILGALIYYKLIKRAHYWSDRKVPHVPAWPLIGSMWDSIMWKAHFMDVTTDWYKKFSNDRYFGYNQFNTACLVIRDLDLIKQIGVKEFETFHDHFNISDPDIESDPLLSKSLINLVGNKWKQMRATLSPAFTTSKMKNMYHLMVECVKDFTTHLEEKKEVDVEMKDLFGRFANGVIASTAFGISVNTVKDPENEFSTMAQKLTQIDFSIAVKAGVFGISPKLAQILKLRLVKQEVADFFSTIIKENIHKRINEGIVRPDLIHLLLEARKGNLKHDDQKQEVGFATVEESHIGTKTHGMDLSDDHIVAQALLFFFAGFDTVSTALSFIAYELAANPHVQKKLQEEIDSVRQKHENVPYEVLTSMKYLDQVISEGLRMWPPAFQTDRNCNKNFTIPAKKPQERSIVIEKDVLCVVPITAIHRDPQYFPDPDKFDPERFSDENKSRIVPGSYMPFGVGPRNCIGSRFALLELKTLFFHLLAKFDLVPNEKTEIPMKISPKKANPAPENGFQLRFKARQ